MLALSGGNFKIACTLVIYKIFGLKAIFFLPLTKINRNPLMASLHSVEGIVV
jgi:hypothetical protein